MMERVKPQARIHEESSGAIVPPERKTEIENTQNGEVLQCLQQTCSILVVSRKPEQAWKSTVKSRKRVLKSCSKF